MSVACAKHSRKQNEMLCNNNDSVVKMEGAAASHPPPPLPPFQSQLHICTARSHHFRPTRSAAMSGSSLLILAFEIHHVRARRGVSVTSQYARQHVGCCAGLKKRERVQQRVSQHLCRDDFTLFRLSVRSLQDGHRLWRNMRM